MAEDEYKRQKNYCLETLRGRLEEQGNLKLNDVVSIVNSSGLKDFTKKNVYEEARGLIKTLIEEGIAQSESYEEGKEYESIRYVGKGPNFSKE